MVALSFPISWRGKVASFLTYPSLHGQPFALLHLPLCYLVRSPLVVGFGSDPSIFCQSKALLREISIAHRRKGSTLSHSRSHFVHFLLTCHWALSGGQLNGMSFGKRLIISRVPVYQSATSIEYLLLVSLAAWDCWALGWTTFLEMQT